MTELDLRPLAAVLAGDRHAVAVAQSYSLCAC